MASDPLVLGFDTSAAHCAAALLCGDRVIAAKAEEMARGQAERLMPLLEEVLSDGGVDWAMLHRIGVGIGPGNFTGIRISVSAARGLALALDIPAVGVSAFEAIMVNADAGALPAVAAPREQLYVQPADGPPELTTLAEAKAYGPPLAFPPHPRRMAENIARAAAAAEIGGAAAPAPLYVKPADAAPSREAAPVILDDDA